MNDQIVVDSPSCAGESRDRAALVDGGSIAVAEESTVGSEDADECQVKDERNENGESLHPVGRRFLDVFGQEGAQILRVNHSEQGF